jgi:hypothetical protein
MAFYVSRSSKIFVILADWSILWGRLILRLKKDYSMVSTVLFWSPVTKRKVLRNFREHDCKFWGALVYIIRYLRVDLSSSVQPGTATGLPLWCTVEWSIEWRKDQRMQREPKLPVVYWLWNANQSWLVAASTIGLKFDDNQYKIFDATSVIYCQLPVRSFAHTWHHKAAVRPVTLTYSYYNVCLLVKSSDDYCTRLLYILLQLTVKEPHWHNSNDEVLYKYERRTYVIYIAVCSHCFSQVIWRQNNYSTVTVQ